MNALKLMKEIYLHPVIQQNVSMQVQLGLPGVLWRNGRLMLRFLPHEEKLDSGVMTYAPPMYDITFDYPSMKLIEFRNLSVMNPDRQNTPAARCELSYLLGAYKKDSEELYRLLSLLLEAFSDKELDQEQVDSYNRYLDRLITQSGLQEIYQVR